MENVSDMSSLSRPVSVGDVRNMFDKIAPTYDKLNGVLSLCINRLWDRRLVRNLPKVAGGLCLDVCTGTGALVPRLSPHYRGVVAVDISTEMLSRGRKRCVGIHKRHGSNLMRRTCRSLTIPSMLSPCRMGYEIYPHPKPGSVRCTEYVSQVGRSGCSSSDSRLIRCGARSTSGIQRILSRGLEHISREMGERISTSLAPRRLFRAARSLRSFSSRPVGSRVKPSPCVAA